MTGQGVARTEPYSNELLTGGSHLAWPIDRALYVLLAVYGAFAALSLALVPLRFLPAEDALILFQYSQNLAQHGSISYLANGAHIEGATDFAWMLLLAGAARMHLPIFWFCAISNVTCLFALGVLLLKLAEQRITAVRLLALAGAAALMPQTVAAASGFAVLPDAVLLTALVLAVVNRQSRRAALLALLLCLFRPDGVLFAAPLLVAVVLRGPARKRNAAWIAAFYVFPGLLYFLWRWHYFGEFLPLPFLVKSDAPRVLGMFVPQTLHQSLWYLVFALLMLVPVLRGARARSGWLLVPLVICPTVFYWAMRLDQNVGARFFYYLPLSVAIMTAIRWPWLSPQRRSLVLRMGVTLWLLLLAMPLTREIRTFRDEQFGTVQAISVSLSRLTPHGSILTTEAGFLPYYSHWPTVDAWGLNTPAFAHRLIQPDDVRTLRPDLIVLHPDRTDACVAGSSWLPAYTGRSWPHMTRNLIRGADPSQYELWLTSYGSEFYRHREHWRYGEGDRECWLVRRNSPLYEGIAQILRAHNAVPPPLSLELERMHAHSALSPRSSR